MGAHRSAQDAAAAGRTITVRWRSVAAIIPAAVLAASGIALAQTGTPSTLTDRRSVPEVPQQALTQPERVVSGVDPAVSGVQPADPRLAPGLELPPGIPAGSAQPVPLDRLGIPAPALAAYRLAAALVGRADPACGIDWALVGAIGRVESDHARFGGNALDSRGVARPGIIGIALDGSRGTARITDTDNGRWDRDTVYDRAVGPMQFIPGTWRVVGSDADGDGVRNPQDMNDAATATAVYLCSGPGDLRQQGDLYSAIRRYNNSDTYVRTVMAIAAAYRQGVSALPASSLPAAHSASSGDGGDAGSVEAAGATTRPDPRSSGGAAGGGSSSASTSTRTSGGGADGSTAPRPGSQPTSASVPPAGGAAGSAASSAVSAVTSVVTSLVTDVVRLPVPIVTTTTPCVVNVLGVKVCTITTITATTTTSTRTTTITKKP